MIGLLGSTGYVGRNMANALRKAGVAFVPILDYRMPSVEQLNYNTIINCAGLADMDRAQWDGAYHEQMLLANAVGPIALRENFNGYLVHISSPFALGEIRSRYGFAKRTADLYMDLYPHNTLTVFPGRLYGGEGSPQLDSLLLSSSDRGLKIDNYHEFNPTPTPEFCDAVVLLMQKEFVGRTLVYGTPRLTAVGFAQKVLGVWSGQWQYTLYMDDAPRPMDSTFNDRFAEYRHVTIEVPLAKPEPTAV